MKGFDEKDSYLSLMTILCVTVMMLIGCYSVSDYSGDGQLIDNGRDAATDRYVLKLGMIDLGKQGTKTYRIMNLPKTNFVVGFEIGFPSQEYSFLDPKMINPTILLKLSDPDGKVIFSKRSSLDSWAWSIPSNESKVFIYGRGEPGTYFNPTPQIEYALTLTVVQSLLNKIEYSAQLLVKSGGWK